MSAVTELYRLAEFNGLSVVVTWSDSLKCFQASIPYCETKLTPTSPFLSGTYGQGDSMEFALLDLIASLKGKWVVISGASKAKRREFYIPDFG